MKEPTYMPLLNSIAVNESKGEILLKAWADATPDAELGAASGCVPLEGINPSEMEKPLPSAMLRAMVMLFP